MRRSGSRACRTAARIVSTAAFVLLAVPLVGTAPAYAHASMVDSSPEQGAVLDALPEVVEFEFSEPMDPTAYVVVTAPDGSALAVGDPEVDGATVTQEVGPGGDGSYLMAVKAVSRDGHPVTGRVEFVVGEPSATTGATEPDPGASVADSPTSTAGGASDEGGGVSWRGHAPWVWWVGPGLLAIAGVLWLAARRAPTA